MEAAAREDEWLTVAEAAEYLKVSPSTLYRWRENGLVSFYHLGPRTVRLKRRELDDVPTPAESERRATVRERREHWTREARALSEELREQFGAGDDSAAFMRRARRQRDAHLGER